MVVEDAIGRPMSDVIRIVDARTHEIIPDLTDAAVDGNATVHLPPNCVLLLRATVSRSRSRTPRRRSMTTMGSRQARSSSSGCQRRSGACWSRCSFRPARRADGIARSEGPERPHQPGRSEPRRGTAASSRCMYLDLDGFKDVNDSLGHPVGDLLLKSVAARLVDCVRASDTVSRTGGDEFVVLLTEAEQVADASIIATRMFDAVAEIHSRRRTRIARHDEYRRRGVPGRRRRRRDTHQERRSRHVPGQGSGSLGVPVLRSGHGGSCRPPMPIYLTHRCGERREQRLLGLRRANHHAEIIIRVLVKGKIEDWRGRRIQRTFFDIVHDADDFYRYGRIRKVHDTACLEALHLESTVVPSTD